MNINVSKAIKIFCLIMFVFFKHNYVANAQNDSSVSSIKVPDKNLNMPTGGNITAEYSDSPKGSDISKIVDNKIKSKFVTHHSKFYVLWDGLVSEFVNTYSLTSANDAPQKDPASWTLSGSDDNVVWRFLDKQENQLFSSRGETKEYFFENKTAFRYYKLTIEGNSGNESTQIAEWKMQMIWNDIEDLMQYSGGNTHSELTPMGKFFENRHETTEEDRIWLNDPKQDTPIPEGDKRILQYFKVKLYPSKEPKPSDVNQRNIDNCSALAVHASMAYSYPDFVKSIIKDNKNRTYTVSLFDPQGKPVEVSVSSNFLIGKNKKLVGSVSKKNVPSWSSILEKAMIKYNYIYKINPNYDVSRLGTEYVLSVFTGEGNSFAFAQFTISPQNLTRVVNICLKQGKFVLGSFNKSNWPVDGSKTITAHVYSFMLSPNNKALFLMRNPWGFNPNVGGENDGILRIPNNFLIPPTIDVRIVEPGAAANFKLAVK